MTRGLFNNDPVYSAGEFVGRDSKRHVNSHNKRLVQLAKKQTRCEAGFRIRAGRRVVAEDAPLRETGEQKEEFEEIQRAQCIIARRRETREAREKELLEMYQREFVQAQNPPDVVKAPVSDVTHNFVVIDLTADFAVYSHDDWVLV
uniref:Uncharacterized protein n=1 Tax=Noctiluca scintillans TaxID=2966 RepID=A0A6T8W680_NOCSC|mmetsp:Transcript_2614/g.7813  ORF Transcript_2614/g.7813 Transcript_2614/m.7813 type:complete len:146 (+) Transcript_2614:194-631(+)|eukprot:CAMPEP_0194502296 /NCGR_PEP_ID=MMETSP0253-20130528/25187_1 /TAXON_ID=2966 /ORGANISM="Noctiluca scintillans" /LENGTH=145 /DNA_ID=CAMNT_0039344423 /DNA_START=192 /DNA_END=629 /DNA_ORIENTATION=+